MSGNPFLDAAGISAPARLTSDQLAQIAQQIPGARVTSGYRDPAHNAAVGGVPNSQHIAGTALDFVAPGMSIDDVRSRFPGEQVLQHDAGSGMHFHVQGAPGTETPAAPTEESAPPPPPAGPNPFLAAMGDDTNGGNASPPNVAGQADSANSGGIVPNLGSGDPVSPQAQAGWGDTFKSYGRGLAALTPTTDALVNGRNFTDSLRDDATGFASGVAKVPATALHLGADVVGFTGDKKDADILHRWGSKVGGYFDTLAADPNSSAHRWSQLEGEIGATAPVSELTIMSDAARAAKAGKLASGLARYGDMAAQGAAAGAATSGGKDMGKAALEGAALAPAVGVAGDILIPPAIRAGTAVTSKAKALASSLSRAAGVEAPEAGKAAEITQTIRKGNAVPDGFYPDETGRPILTVNIEGGVPKTPQPITPKSATPEDMRIAMGSRGSNNGIEANTFLAPDVAAHVDQLRLQGVPLDQALREAEITAVGAKPTIAAVTRDPQEQAAVWEGAKQATPEGRALSAQIAQNNAAVVQRVQNMVQDLGGVPAQGEAAETAAQSLAKASDAEKAKVNELYQAADTEAQAQRIATDAKNNASTQAYSDKAKALYAGGGGKPISAPPVPDVNPGYISLKPLNEALNAPDLVNPTIDGGRTLRNGIRGLVKAYGGDGGQVTLAQAERIRQAINDAYDPMGGGINGHVGRLKAALDRSIDATEAGPKFKEARAAYKAWAEKYDDPQGIASLIKRDAQGNFVNADNWRKAENLIGSTADKPFIQVVNQLKANGDTASLNRLKAAVIQRAYQRATNNATDKLGNSILNGKIFFNELNQVGTPKLNALFSPQELSDIATTGRAAIHMNEAVPGSLNTSNTSSALVKALEAQGKKTGKLRTALKIGAHGVSLVTGHLGGNIATEGAGKVVEAATEHGKARQLAKALTESMNPANARATQRAKAAKMAAQIARKSQANKISKRLAVTGAAIAGGKR